MCLFYATAMWNQFFNALMYLQDDNKMPLQVVLKPGPHEPGKPDGGSSGDAMVTKQKLAEQLKYCIVVVSRHRCWLYIHLSRSILQGRNHRRSQGIIRLIISSQNQEGIFNTTVTNFSILRRKIHEKENCFFTAHTDYGGRADFRLRQRSTSGKPALGLRRTDC